MTHDWMVIAVVRPTALMALVTVALLVGLAGAVADSKISIYGGQSTALTLGSWGAGSIAEDAEQVYLQSPALRIETKGFYEGARLELSTPVDGAPFLSKPENAYLALAVLVPEPKAAPAPAPGAPGFPAGEVGAFPAAPPGGPAFPAAPPGGPVAPGGGVLPPPPVEPGMPLPGEPGVAPPEGGIIFPGGEMPTKPAEAEKISRLRVLLLTDRGELDSGPITLADYPKIVEDWRNIVLPLSVFGGTVDLTGAKILGVALFGDAEKEFYLGELTLGQEDQPLVADAGDRMVVKANTEVKFRAQPQPGGVTASYVWDFDDLDGLQEQGYGPEVTWTFLTPGYYTVTLLVSDPAGKKATRMDRLAVKVE